MNLFFFPWYIQQPLKGEIRGRSFDPSGSWSRFVVGDRIVQGPDRNRVHELFNTTVKNLRTTHSVSTVGCSQSIPSIQTPEFEAILNQRVHDRTTNLNKKYKQFIADYEEPRWMVIKMTSHMGDPCAPPYWPHNLDDNQRCPPPMPPLF